MSYEPLSIKNPICILPFLTFKNLHSLTTWSLMRHCQDKCSSTYIETILLALLMRKHQGPGPWSIIIKCRSQIKNTRNEGHYVNNKKGRSFRLMFKWILSCYFRFLMLAKVSTLKKKVFTIKVILCLQMKIHSFCQRKATIVTF